MIAKMKDEQKTAANNQKKCIFAILTPTNTGTNQPRPISETTLIETLKDCNETQRRLIQLQAEKIESLTAQLNTLKLYPFKAAKWYKTRFVPHLPPANGENDHNRLKYSIIKKYRISPVGTTLVETHCMRLFFLWPFGPTENKKAPPFREVLFYVR